MSASKCTAWQPIETATRDGSRTLIAWLSFDHKWVYSFARYDATLNHYVLEERDAAVGARCWMPIPSPESASANTISTATKGD